MRMKLLAAAGLAWAAVSPALAQLDPAAEARLVPPPMTTHQEAAGVNATLGTGALPGVGMATTTTTERGGSAGGPGGLSGGVGAAGVPVPGLMSGAPDATAPLRGIPLETTPGVPANTPVR